MRGYEVGRLARERGAWVIYGGIHATLYPEEALERGHAHCVVKGDGDVIWSKVLDACVKGKPKEIYEGGKIDADQFVAARWDLLPAGQIHVGLGADGAWLSEALLFLLRLAH